MTDTTLPTLDWHDLGTPHGKGFTDTLRPYDRLPGRAEALVPEAVWDLSRMASGLFTRVRTNATTIAVRYTLGLPELGMTHMPPTAVSGIDLYADTPDGDTHSRWIAVAHPATFPNVEALLADGIDAGERDFTLWFPLFNRVESAEIGLTPGASFTLLPEDETPPIVYYGTSIIHGASASRPGMTVSAQLSRRLGRRVLGLGFSGNGKMEVELAELIAEIPAAVYVIDCLPNMDADLVAERALPFLEALRAKRPDTPILLVEDRTLEHAWVVALEREKHAARRAELRAAYDAMIAQGDTHITLIPAEGLLGTDGDGTVDCSHPTDLGFFRQADILEPVLRSLIDG
ncbi:MAG: SGNH/GDSL hydrolase family protein [Thermomicrobiales bacterium]